LVARDVAPFASETAAGEGEQRFSGKSLSAALDLHARKEGHVIVRRA
jgi:hypothetical protein